MSNRTEVLVIAGSHLDFLRYANQNESPDKHFVYLTSARALDNYPLGTQIEKADGFHLSAVNESPQLKRHEEFLSKQAAPSERATAKLPDICRIYEEALSQIDSPLAQEALKRARKLTEE